MSRLPSELQRLYLAPGPGPARLLTADGRTRALVLALARPPSWEALALLWQGVQADLGLPAPAIAVSGTDALQLWFSLAEPVTVARGQAFLQRLQQRYLAGVEARRVRLLPVEHTAGAVAGVEGAAAEALPAAPQGALHAALVPAVQPGTGNWSAFLAPELAPVFADTPWLDTPPNEEGQATLLRALSPLSPADFEAAWSRLEPAAPPEPAAHPASSAPGGAAPAPAGPLDAAPPSPSARPAAEDPHAFLLRVMNDESVDLALRIEAARALLPHR